MVCTLHFSKQQQTEELVYSQASTTIFSRNFTQEGAHTRLVLPNEADDDGGKTNSAWVLLQHLSIHEVGWIKGFLPLRVSENII